MTDDSDEEQGIRRRLKRLDLEDNKPTTSDKTRSRPLQSTSRTNPARMTADFWKRANSPEPPKRSGGKSRWDNLPKPNDRYRDAPDRRQERGNQREHSGREQQERGGRRRDEEEERADHRLRAEDGRLGWRDDRGMERDQGGRRGGRGGREGGDREGRGGGRGGRGGADRGRGGGDRGGRGGRGGRLGEMAPRGRGRQFLDDTRPPPQPRTPRRMGFRKLEEYARKDDPTEVLHHISAEREGFWLLLDSAESIDTDWIIHVLKILQTAFRCTTSSNLMIQCLTKLRSSRFITQHAGLFFMQITVALPLKQQRMLVSAKHYLQICRCLLEKMPSSSAEILMSLTSLRYTVDRLKKDTELIEEDLNSELTEVMNQCEEKTQRNVQRAKMMDRHNRGAPNTDDLAPPDDFRQTDVFPTLDDLLIVDKPFLRANKVEGAYRGVDHYLDVQFRLLREDFIRPLRNGINEYLKQQHDGVQVRRLQDLRLYHDVRILFPVCNHNGLTYRLRFDSARLRKVNWQSSKRLIFGSLVCLSNDDFQTMIFATVVDRSSKDLEEGELEVQFEHNADAVSEISPDESFLMAETTAFFEAYRHVLTALKEVREENFPFKDYIVDCKTDTRLPRYLDPESKMDLSPLYDDAIRIDHEQKLTEESSDSNDSDEDPFNLDNILGGMRRGIVHERRRLERQNRQEKNQEQLEMMKKVPEALKHVQVGSKVQWPDSDVLHLDSSQLKALKLGLTQEFAIIQGPPGTGKTYLGLKIAKTLLHNKHLWKERRNAINRGIANNQASPILVVCYTNHALDQFLEGIAQFQRDGIVRVGGRSKSEVLQNCLVKVWRRRVREQKLIPQHAHNLYYDARDQMNALNLAMSNTLVQIDVADKGIMQEEVLFNGNSMSERHYNAICSSRMDDGFGKQRGRKKESCMPDWLGVGAGAFFEQIASLPHEEGDEEPEDEDIEIEEENTFAKNQRMGDDDDGKENAQRNKEMKQAVLAAAAQQLAFQPEVLDMEGDRRDGAWQVTRATRKKNKRKLMIELRKADAMSEEEVAVIRNINTLDYPSRWRLYRYWLSEYKKILRQTIRVSERQYQAASDRMKESKDAEDMYIMQNAVVIGMTTTGAARYYNVLQQVRPKIVIVEEAAEVLEAHIVTTLTDSCEHLILIGDHQQLRPNPTVYELAEKYSLKISLFERMINNGQHVVTLENQHRMRPEISSLMKHIYPNLHDHESVMEYEQIRSISSSVFFIDHTQPEMGDEELKSKANDFEARYIAKLCGYLLLQGYKATQITILTPYTGQLFQLRRYMPKGTFQGVRVCAVDNFQGEENDIVLLSLVRSNADGKLGFLAEDNRVCVLLSRAKMGFYVIGNFTMLAQKTNLWAEVANTLKKQNMIGPSLGLYCSKHPDYKVDAKDARDFDKAPEGGCMRPCGYRLECGHACALVCHPYDPDHIEYECKKRCARKICDRGHKCPRLCHEICGDCMVPVPRTMPKCGHKQNVPCYVETEDFSCRRECSEVLSCGHFCQNDCGDPVHTTKCREVVEKLLPCGHKCKMACHTDPTEFVCDVKCKSVLKCEHDCSGTCGKCFTGRLHRACGLGCNRVLVCGHVCSTSCPAACPPCRDQCQNRCVHSKCQKPCGVTCSACKEPCEWRCKHYVCTKACSEPCDRPRCDRPCQEKLKCRHPCIGMCGEKCPKLCRVCNKDQVQDIFFGTEDEPDARFVELEDCGHVFEVTGMDHYMDMAEEYKEGKQVIQMKKCPRCQVIIRTNLRYGKVIKAILRDIEAVKKQLVGNGDQAKRKQAALSSKVILLPECAPKERMMTRLEKANLTPEELSVVENLINFCNVVQKVNKDATKYLKGISVEKKFIEIQRQIRNFEIWMINHVQTLHLSEQELQESQAEVTRLQLLTIAYKLYLEVHKPSSTVKLEDDIEKGFLGVIQVLQKKALTTQLENACRDILAKVEKETHRIPGLGIDDKERVAIVQAMGLSKGHWFKCPKGHVYAIGDCGGATMESKCPECGSGIGGTAHRVRSDNTLASEMDGAPHPAWSEQANMENYRI